MTSHSKFRSGNAVFHFLTEIRRTRDAVLSSLKYSHPAPEQSVHSAEYIQKNPENPYFKIRHATPFKLNLPHSVPPYAEWRFAKEQKGVFPEQFILELPHAKVLGEGHVITCDNHLLADLAMDFHRHIPYHWLLHTGKVPEPEVIPGSIAVLSSPGSINYFHWTLDTLPRFQLLQEYVQSIDWFYMNCNARFHKEWISMLQIPDSKILPADRHTHYQADKLIVPSYAGEPGFPTRQALGFIRKYMPEPENKPDRKLYISRSKSSRRKITNEDALMPLFSEHGFELIHLAGRSVREQMELFASATHIVSPHGAELTNLVYCTEGTKVLEIFSPYYVNPCYWKIAEQLMLDYSCTMGTGGRSLLKKHKDPHYVWANIRLDRAQFSQLLADFSRIQTEESPD